MRQNLRAMTLATALLALGSSARAAVPEQSRLVFSGYASRDGSISQPGATTEVVYLFFDATMGDLADKLPQGATVELQRLSDGAVLDSFGAHDVRAVGEVAAFYADAANQRRGLGTALSLAAALADPTTFGATSPTPLAPTELPPILVGALNEIEAGTSSRVPALRGWLAVASRLDLGVAWAHHRAFVDRTAPPSGDVTYRLSATADGTTKVLGAVTVHRGNPLALVGAASFVAVPPGELARCDAPDAGLAHGGVALSWDLVGDDDAERDLVAQSLAGWDLYRSAGPCASPQSLNLRTLAAAQSHDGRGRVALTGLARVNDLPLQPTPAPARGPSGRRTLAPDPADTLTPGRWLPTFAQVRDEPAALAAAGFGPGDDVCYYLVPIDLSGNYGETVALHTRVPDMRPPVAPWDIAAVADVVATVPTGASNVPGATSTFALRWLDVNVANYRGDRMTYDVECGARPSAPAVARELTVAATTADCGVPGRATTVNVAVADYLVYRFETDSEALEFEDSDGDGTPDAAERGVASDGPGAACSPGGSSTAAQGARVAVVPATAAILDATGRRVMTFEDSAPAANKGKTYYYRIAARGVNGVVSALSAPVRGAFPDERQPARWDDADVAYGTCRPYGEVSASPYGDVLAIDYTGRAAGLRLFCAEPVPPLSEATAASLPSFIAGRLAGYLGTLAFEAQPALGARVVRATDGTPGAALCTLLDSFRGESDALTCTISADVVADDGSVLGTVADVFEGLGDPSYACDFNVETLDDCVGPGFRPITPGQVVGGATKLTVPLTDATDCAILSASVAGKPYRIGRKCGPGTATWDLELPDLGAGLQCLELTRSNGNQQLSTTTYLPCAKPKPAVDPPTPGLDQLDLPPTGTTATLTWVAPEGSAGIVAEWWEEGGTRRGSRFFPASGRFGRVTPALTAPIDLATALPSGATETWCVRARTLSASTPDDAGGKLSAWTPTPLCGVRRAGTTPLPQYLGWPSIPAATVGSPLDAPRWLAGDGVIAVRVGSIARPMSELWPTVDGAPLCGVSAATITAAACDGVSRCLRYSLVSSCLDFCADVNAAADAARDVMVYRQRRDPATQAVTPFVQVTPYLDRPFCTLIRCQGLHDGPTRAAPDCRDDAGCDDHDPCTDEYCDLGERTCQSSWVDACPQGCATYGGFLLATGREQPWSAVQDPYFAAVPVQAGTWPSLDLLYTDRTPFIGGQEYRYEFVYFDQRGEPYEVRDTPWLLVPGGTP